MPYLCPMRIIATIPHSEMRISIFGMNQKYILKLEWGPLEQSYKWDEYDFQNIQEFIDRIQASDLLPFAMERFKLMSSHLSI